MDGIRRAGASDASLIAGLCADCRHGRRIESARQATFFLCRRSAIDPTFPKYPRLPVVKCSGYAPPLTDDMNVDWDQGNTFEDAMRISDLLLLELDEEATRTRRTLERVPAGKGDFAPHPKSMPLGRLAPHVAELAGFGLSVLTGPGLDFSQHSYTPLPFESAAQLVRVFDEGTAKVRSALQAVDDEAWTEPWKLSFQGKTLFEGTRFVAYRQMFVNHIVHHRAQLGVYLRLTDEPVPATYGPSADEPMGS